MIHSLFTKIGIAISGLLITLAGHFAPATVINDALGSTIPNATALFQTSLASPISSSDTSMTLVSGTDKSGITISGYTCFTLDSGQTNQEFVCGTASSTSVTSMVRGINPTSGTTTVSSLQFSHRRGADVKITDYPVLGIIRNIVNGNDTFPNAVTYGSGVTISSLQGNTQNLASVAYVNQVATSGAPYASTLVAGISKMSTAPASSTNPIAVGDNDVRLTGKSGSALSSTNPAIDFNYTATTSTASKVVVASSTGKIDTGWIDTGTTSSKVLQLDGSAKIPAVDGSQITNLSASSLISASTSPVTVSNAVSGNLFSVTIPANTLSTNKAIRVKARIDLTGSGTTATQGLALVYGGATTTSQTVCAPSGGTPTGTCSVVYEAIINASSTTALQKVYASTLGATPASFNSPISVADGTSAIDSTASQTLNLRVTESTATANLSTTILSYTVEELK